MKYVKMMIKQEFTKKKKMRGVNLPIFDDSGR